MTPYETLRVEPAPGSARDVGVRCLVLNRPEVMNAMNTQMFVELRAALHELAYDDGLRVLIVTGAGERAFCTGGDLKQRDGMTDHQWRRQHQLAEEVLLAVKDFPLPVIAAVEGHAHGGGCELALMCDWIVAARSAVFSLPEVRRGIMPDAGGCYLLPRIIGLHRAKELMFLGEDCPAAEAERIGLVNRVVPAAELDASVDELARKFLSLPTKAIGLTKRLTNRSLESSRQQSFDDEAHFQDLIAHSADMREGIASFLERRDPRFTGR